MACDHWNRYSDDINLIRDIGVRYYRFSVEWSKIEPQMGVYNQDALNVVYNTLISYSSNQFHKRKKPLTNLAFLQMHLLCSDEDDLMHLWLAYCIAAVMHAMLVAVLFSFAMFFIGDV